MALIVVSFFNPDHTVLNIPFILILLVHAAGLLFVVVLVLLRRIRMERRARALLAKHEDAESLSFYLEFRSGWKGGKEREMDAKIAEMATDGWLFLRARAANPLRTIHSWGGRLHLHFIRVHPPELDTTPANNAVRF